MFQNRGKINEKQIKKKTKVTERQKSNDESEKKRSSTIFNFTTFPMKKKSTEPSGNISVSPSNKNSPVEKINQSVHENSRKKMTDIPTREYDSISNLKLEMEKLETKFKTEINFLKNENENLQSQVNQIKAEMTNLVRQQNSSFRNSLNELDVGIRVLNDVIRNTQAHYAKFVPFVVKQILHLMRKQEYFSHLQNPVTSSRFFETFQSDFFHCHSPGSKPKPYSVSILPIAEKELYKLSFIPMDISSLSKINEEANEYIYSLPTVYEGLKKPLRHSISVPNSNIENSILGSKNINNNLKNSKMLSNKIQFNMINNNDAKTLQSKNSVIHSTNQSHRDKDGEEDLQILDNFNNANLKFKDSKIRYLRWKYQQFRSKSFPSLKMQSLTKREILNDKQADLTIIQDNSTEDESVEENSEECLCQSDTELLGDKFRLNESLSFDNIFKVNTNNHRSTFYYSFTKSIINELRKYEVKQASSNDNSCPRFGQEFSIILPQSKLSSLLDNNFTNISQTLMSSEDENFSHQDSPARFYNVIKDESFDTLSDGENYMDDDYGQQHLLSQFDFDYGFNNICLNLENFTLPQSSVKNVFINLK